MSGKQLDQARVHIWVTGHVQGVGFRAFAQRTGLNLGLSGWVRNLEHNTVEMVAEGLRFPLDEFVEIIKRGPSAGRVQDARTEWETPTGEFNSFVVKYSL